MRLHESFLLFGSVVSAFVVKDHTTCRHASLQMVGGPGWDNGSFLDGLSSGNSNKDNEQSYQEFKETRAAFVKRQQERMNTDAGKKFMEQMQQRPSEEMMGDNDDGIEGVDEAARAPSRFRQMMEQASYKGMKVGRGQRPPGLEWMRGPPGLQQKLAIPLDDDEEEDDNEDG